MSQTVKFGSLVPELEEKPHQPNQANLIALTANVRVVRGLDSTATSEPMMDAKTIIVDIDGLPIIKY